MVIDKHCRPEMRITVCCDRSRGDHEQVQSLFSVLVLVRPEVVDYSLAVPTSRIPKDQKRLFTLEVSKIDVSTVKVR
jgi:hypothetical protein